MNDWLGNLRQNLLGDTDQNLGFFRCICLALMGGLVRELVTEGQHSLVKFIVGGFIGVFCGLIVYYICKHFGVEEHLTAALIGLGGYTGIPVLEIGSKKLKKWLGGIIK